LKGLTSVVFHNEILVDFSKEFNYLSSVLIKTKISSSKSEASINMRFSELTKMRWFSIIFSNSGKFSNSLLSISKPDTGNLISGLLRVSSAFNQLPFLIIKSIST